MKILSEIERYLRSRFFSAPEAIISGFDVCSKMEQFKMYEELYFNLSYNELRYTEDKTGCLHPCSYNEYQVADKQEHHGIVSGLYIAYGTLTVTVRKEVQKKISNL